MRYLILSDIHANREAFSAVLSFVRRKRWDKAIFLGDLVGYGANPNQTVDLLRELRPLVAIRGNHDKVCSGIENGELFNRVALQAAMWTRQKLTASNLKWLHQLPEGPAVVDGAFAISHGTPIDEDAYIFGEIEALNVFRQTTFPVCFFGHSHFPVVFGLSPDAIQTVLTMGPSFRFKLKPGVRYLINPGSIGQPRDRDPKAAYMTFDSERRIVRWYRVDYPIERAQQRILKAGLPKVLADRLALGV
jgi:predicted phosphodiesterase